MQGMFPVIGFWNRLMFGKDGIVPRWLGVSFYVALGIFGIYSAFAK